MTTEQLNMGLIEEMKEKIPAGTSLAKTLMDILFVGKEAVYRRLRSEVPFTLAEVVTISRKLGISVDKLMGTSSPGNAMFDLSVVKTASPGESYYNVISRYIKEIATISREEDSEVAFSSNTVPRNISLQYEILSKFQFYKWLYQYDKVDFHTKFEEMPIPDRVQELHKQYVGVHQDFRTSIYIWDKALFTSLINDIRYFAGIGLLSAESVLRMKEELHSMINQIEFMATVGRYPNGHNVYMYLSSVNFDAAYGYMKACNYHIGLIKIYSINILTSKDPELYKGMKEWIMSLTKFSILISQSGEMHRRAFFNSQRKIIDLL